MNLSSFLDRPSPARKARAVVSRSGKAAWAIPVGIVSRAHRVITMSLCDNIKQARRLEAPGGDVIIAQGHEAGGHTGRIGTMTLVPQIADLVRLPMLAAVEIADGRLLRRACTGRRRVWMGPPGRLCRTHAHVNYKVLIDQFEKPWQNARSDATAAK